MNVNSSTAAGLAGPAPITGPGEQALGQEDFLELMLAQLQNQDPMKPMENGDFLAQMAQFSTVQGITDLNSSVSSLAGVFNSSQLLDASSLIGREVMILSPTLTGGESRDAAVDIPSSGEVRVQINNANGELVQTMNLGLQPAGRVNFEIPELPEGAYNVQAVVGSGSGARQFDVAVADRIRGVSLDRSGGATTLELAQLGNVDLSEVSHIREESE